MSSAMDRLMTRAELMERWRFSAEPSPSRAVLAQLDRMMGRSGLRAMAGTRGERALFRPMDIMRAEKVLAEKGGNSSR